MWLAVDKDGVESISNEKPTYDGFDWACLVYHEIESEVGTFNEIIIAPKGTIERILGKELTLKESPVEVTKIK